MDTVHSCLRITAGVLATLKTRPDALKASLCPEMLATDLAEYLVRKVIRSLKLSPDTMRVIVNKKKNTFSAIFFLLEKGSSFP